MLVSAIYHIALESELLTRCHSLEKEPGRRATPWWMHDHPWMAEMKTKRVDMGLFLKRVWDWSDEDET